MQAVIDLIRAKFEPNALSTTFLYDDKTKSRAYYATRSSAETELLVQVGAAQIVVVIHGRTTPRPGEIIQLAVDTDAVHLFDPASGVALRRAWQARATCRP